MQLSKTKGVKLNDPHPRFRKRFFMFLGWLLGVVGGCLGLLWGVFGGSCISGSVCVRVVDVWLFYGASVLSCTKALVTVFGKYVAQKHSFLKETFIVALAREDWPRKYLVKRCALVAG